jgi:alanine racemase
MIAPNTWVEIDRLALLANIHVCRSLIGPRCRLLALVKGNAYGHGLQEMARLFSAAGVDCLGVEAIPEAVSLRTAGISCPILLAGPIPPGNVPLLVSQQITPLLTSLEQVHEVGEFTLQQACGVEAHLKFDTGMHRQGLMGSELPMLIDLLVKYPGLRVTGLATHLARADEPDQPEWTQRQLEVFHGIITSLAAAGLHVPLRHAANSAATLLWPETHLEMVRLGIALYGFWPGDAVRRCSTGRLSLQPVITWKTRVSAVKRVPRGCSVGYNGSYVTTREACLALLPLGYYDGYSRSLSNRGEVLIHGLRAPVCGHVSMNLMTIDVTDIPAVQPGDEVVLLGRQGGGEVAAEEIAGWLGTIHYEVTTRINPLIPRLVVHA